MFVVAVAEGCSGRSVERSRGRGDASGGESGERSGGSGGSAGIAQGGSAVGGRATGGDGGTMRDGGAGEEPNAGEAGAAGVGDAGGEGGGGGRGGAGGAGGAGAAGMGGTQLAGMGGSGAGGAGGRPSAVECRSNEDCYLLDDCCGNCSAEPVPSPGLPPRCRLVCDQTACALPGIRADEVICRGGQCILDRSCNAVRRTCDSLPPACPDGQVPSIDDSGCWGPCLAPTECREVTSCADCANDLCVESGQRIITTCRARSFCEEGSYCQCLEPCGAGAVACSEDEGRVSCTCITCG